MPLPALGIVLASRGPASFTGLMAIMVSTAAIKQALDFDALIGHAPDLISNCKHLMKQEIARNGGAVDAPMGYEVGLAGWSARKGRMAAWLFWDDPSQGGEDRLELDHDWPAAIAPRFDHEDWELNPPRTSAAMLALARLQVQEARTKGPPGTGGRLLVADLTRSGVSIFDHGDLGPASTALAMPDPKAVEVQSPTIAVTYSGRA